MLGPLLFVLYIHDIVSIGEKHGVSVDLYADDSQWYFSFSPLNERSAAVENIRNCVAELEIWMLKNYLKMNFTKTNVLFLGDPSYCKIFNDNIGLDLQGKTFTYDLSLIHI